MVIIQEVDDAFNEQRSRLFHRNIITLNMSKSEDMFKRNRYRGFSYAFISLTENSNHETLTGTRNGNRNYNCLSKFVFLSSRPVTRFLFLGVLKVLNRLVAFLCV
jgi:hypothetical protein